MQILYISLFQVFIILSCKSESTGRNEVVQERPIYIGYMDYYISGGLEKKYMNDGTTNTELAEIGCNDWVLNEDQLIDILKKFKLVGSEEWNQSCYTYPCYYKGVVKNEGGEYTMIINSASYVNLYSKQESLYFILEDKNSDFLTPCSCCEDD